MKWWDWSDPAFTFAFITIVISFLSFIATVIIPVLLRRLEEKSSKNQKILDSLERLTRSQRIDYLTKRLKESQDAQELAHLGEEVEEWPEGPDKDDLARLYCNNLYTPLHKYSSFFLRNYLALIMKKFVKRFRIKQNGHEDDLKYFIERLKRENLNVPYGSFAEVYTDPESALCLDKGEGLQFYRELVRSIPELSSYLIGYAGLPVLKDFQYGGFKANVLTGVLLGSLENIANDNMKSDSPKGYKYTLLSSLANGMHGGGLFYGLGEWDNSRYSDTITWLAALIVETLGSVSKTSSQDEQHLMMRSIQILPSILSQIHQQALKDDPSIKPEWGLDDERVYRGVEALKINQPALWKQYGQDIETELDKMGTSWRNP
ncbi:MAG: hypothetical protein ACFN1F_08810 [Segatella sp.]